MTRVGVMAGAVVGVVFAAVAVACGPKALPELPPPEYEPPPKPASAASASAAPATAASARAPAGAAGGPPVLPEDDGEFDDAAEGGWVGGG